MSDNNLTPRIEQLAPELEKIISTSEPIEHLADGFGGAQGPAEGPLWWEDGGYLLFSDIHNDRRMKYQPGSGVSLFLEPTNRANGLTRDPQGRLVACEHDSRRVTRQEADGSITVVANSTLSLLADDFVLPNGLAFSPDESVLYINDTRRGHIRAFELLPSGMLAKHTDRVFADLRGPEPGVPDGMKVDVEGNVYCGGAGGIWVMDPAGKKLGRIVHGAPATTNLAFGGDDWRTLYITRRNPAGERAKPRSLPRATGGVPSELEALSRRLCPARKPICVRAADRRNRPRAEFVDDQPS